MDLNEPNKIVVITTGDTYSKLLFHSVLNNSVQNNYKIIGVVNSNFTLKAKLKILKSAIQAGSLIYVLYMFLEEFTLGRLNKNKQLLRNLHLPDIFEVCKAKNIRVISAPKINSDNVISEIQKLNPDILLALRSGQIFRKKFIENCPEIRNIHTTHLPKYRGVAGVFQTLLHDEDNIAITYHKISNEKVDAGDIIYQKIIPVDKSLSLFQITQDLYQKTANILPLIINKETAYKQNETLASYFTWPSLKEILKFKRNHNFFKYL